MRLRFLVVILPRESQAHFYVLLDDLRCAKALCDGLPAGLPFFCRRQYGRSQMVRVQPVIARLWVRQAVAWRFGLSRRVGAPQAQRCGRYQVWAAGFGYLPLLIGFLSPLGPVFVILWQEVLKVSVQNRSLRIDRTPFLSNTVQIDSFLVLPPHAKRYIHALLFY